jgi:hypothetical protein
MRYLELLVDGKKYTNEHQINKILQEMNLSWLIDSEIEGAKLEIKRNTLIWHSGSFYSGDWHYGIFKNGEFYGNWENGIFENGNFFGKWHSGINLIEDIKN